MWTVEYYGMENGRTPLQEFLDSLDEPMRTKVLWEINVLRDGGNTLTMPYARYMKDGIYELRISYTSNIARAFYFFYVGNKIIITNGFIKKAQKTPPEELKKAKKYKLDYERRCAR